MIHPIQVRTAENLVKHRWMLTTNAYIDYVQVQKGTIKSESVQHEKFNAPNKINTQSGMHQFQKFWHGSNDLSFNFTFSICAVTITLSFSTDCV